MRRPTLEPSLLALGLQLEQLSQCVFTHTYMAMECFNITAVSRLYPHTSPPNEGSWQLMNALRLAAQDVCVYTCMHSVHTHNRILERV